MGIGGNRRLDNSNLRASNVYVSRGRLDELSAYLCPDMTPNSFIISGGAGTDDRYEPLYEYFDAVIGRMPVIVLHNNDDYLVSMVYESWQNTAGQEGGSPLWVIDERFAEFEPFYGMGEMQLSLALRQLAQKLNYSVTPRFERVVKAHAAILEQLEIPISLSGLYYLCRFEDMGEFYGNVMSLPGGEAQARRIWADLSVDVDTSNNQFDLFRSVIQNLAHDAEKSGWDYGRGISELNCLQAIGSNAVMLLPVNDTYSEMLLPYLAEELKSAQAPFALIIDDVRICDEQFLKFLSHAKAGCACGIVAENIVELLNGEEEAFSRVAGRMNTLIVLKHGTGYAAAALSETIGRYDYMKAEASTGTSRGFFKFLPQDRHTDVRYSIENRYRVMPEEITALRAGQAIVFNMGSDAVIKFN